MEQQSLHSPRPINIVPDVAKVNRELVPPYRFGYVCRGICRGAYPTLRNFRFLYRLQLHTVISLVPEDPTSDLKKFAAAYDIKIVHIPLSRLSTLSDALKISLISALNICIDPANHPLFIHCLDGRRIASLLVLLLRRVQGWTPLSSLSEYWRFQASNRTPIPTLEVEKTTRDLESFASEINDVVLPDELPKWLWGGDRQCVVQGIRIKQIAPLVNSKEANASSAITNNTSASLNSSSNNNGTNVMEGNTNVTTDLTSLCSAGVENGSIGNSDGEKLADI